MKMQLAKRAKFIAIVSCLFVGPTSAVTIYSQSFDNPSDPEDPGSLSSYGFTYSVYHEGVLYTEPEYPGVANVNPTGGYVFVGGGSQNSAIAANEILLYTDTYVIDRSQFNDLSMRFLNGGDAAGEQYRSAVRIANQWYTTTTAQTGNNTTLTFDIDSNMSLLNVGTTGITLGASTPLPAGNIDAFGMLVVDQLNFLRYYDVWVDSGGGGTGTVAWNIDGSGNWNTGSNWASGTIPNGIDATASFLDKITAARTVYTDTPVTVGTLNFDNANTYVITGSSSLTIDVNTGSGLIDVVQGTHKINLPLQLNDDTTAVVAAGATLVIADPLLLNGKTLTKSGAGTLSIISTVSSAAPASIAATAGVVAAPLDLGATTSVNVSGGTVLLQATQRIAALNVSGGRVTAGPGSNVVVKTGTFSVSGSGQLDLQSSKLIIDNAAASYSSVQAAVAAGSITSSMLNADRRIGVGIASDLFTTFPASFGGEQIINSGAVVAALAVLGDANLDGTVSSNDFNLFVARYGQTAGSRWTQGDFNADLKVNTLDFNLLAGHFGQSLSAPGLGAVVPEPTTLGAAALVMTLCIPRRSRR